MEFGREPERLWVFDWDSVGRAGAGDEVREGSDGRGVTGGDEIELERKGVLVGVNRLDARV
jgi:hypothetical protein